MRTKDLCCVLVHLTNAGATVLRYSALHAQQVDMLTRQVDRHPIADSYRVLRLDLAEFKVGRIDCQRVQGQ